MELVGDHLDDQGGVAADAVVDAQINLDLFFMDSFTILACR